MLSWTGSTFWNGLMYGDFTLSTPLWQGYCVKWRISYTFSHPRLRLARARLRRGKPPESERRRAHYYKYLKILMNKADIVDKVHGVLGSTKVDAERAVECVIDCIVSGLKGGDEVSVAGLGIFATKARPARQGRNPRTGESIHIAASRTAKFRAAKALKDAVK